MNTWTVRKCSIKVLEEYEVQNKILSAKNRSEQIKSIP